MTTDYKFQGWQGLGPDSVEGQMVFKEFEPKPWAETDVDIKVTHCGICFSDIHTLRSGWGPTFYPCCVGHEIVGTAVRVGSKAERNIKIGDRVGVGAQSGSCLKPGCEECQSGLEPYCLGMVPTYNGKYDDGSKSYGGYGNYWRGPSHFVFRIPDALDSSHAAPMLCAGVTVYSPLKKNGCGPGKKVGVVGLGGLGHFGILYAKALGADSVTAISRSVGKKEDALKIGADRFIATNDDEDWTNQHARSLDLIICTASSPNIPLASYLNLLRTNGQLIQVGAPEDSLPSFSAFALIVKGCKIGGSAFGAPHEIEEMLKLSAEKGVKPWVQKRSLKDANQAVLDTNANKGRYKYVLVNEENGGK